ncbi:hypothetical protein HanRHA438_Chr06g0272211 [Helianthus annuus]|nr:hypothetical protein HanRHA438_Chr06g0272211 [Helianthus annuus]
MLRRVSMLRCKTIINRNNYHMQFSRKPAAKIVGDRGIRGDSNISTPVKEHDYWKIFNRVLCGDKHAEPKLASWIHHDIVCLDTVDWFGRRRCPEVYEFDKTAVHRAVFPGN